ncbi:ABC transporter permease [Litchfieldia alkalitelluris]|uniref:ABC transporter permease n=1 Tax=Litchfieldia alkalitelluris TaxID=304268 RepID=UPI00099681CC|nr:ABC transporter permease subunit [Litchfieldia alkalitelluris]
MEEASRVLISESGDIRTAPFPPSKEFPLGSDRDGHDILSHLIVGAKDTFLIILAICFIRYVLAIPLGLIASRRKNIFSSLLSIWNLLFSSVPPIFSAMILLSIPMLVMSENRLYVSILILALFEVGKVGYIVQQEANAVMKKPFIEAGVTVGVTPLKQLINHVLPNITSVIVVNFFVDIGRTALLIGQMGIFGIFISQVYIQTGSFVAEMSNTSFYWMTLLGQARDDIMNAIWIPIYTSLAITFTIFTFNILGEGLRRYFGRETL